MTYQTISLTIDPRGIACLELARPEKHNAMNALMLDELLRSADDLDTNPSVRAVVISGQGNSFCAGADLGWMRANLNKNRQERIEESQKLTQLLHRFSRLSKLLIAKVNGQAFAGGIGLICACDIAIGARTAKFSLTETKLGLAPANIAPYVIKRMGPQNARRCMLNAHFFKGDEAVALGLLDTSVAADALNAAVEKEIAEALNCSPNAIAITKTLINRLATLDADQTMQYTSELLADMWEHDEAKDGITAFFDKRKPQWVA